MLNRFVDKLECFAPLTAADISALFSTTAKARTIGSKQDLIREGDRPGPVFVMLEGWACRYKILPDGSRQIMAFLMPGDTCDIHISVLAEMDHGIQTLTESRVATIPKGDMERMILLHPNIAQALWTSQLIDEGTLRAWIVSMGRRSSIARVSHLMCELYLRARNVGLTKGNDFTLPMTQIVLADALGMTPVHINRVLRVLREARVMQIETGSIAILDPVKLAEIAGFDENYLHRRLRQAA